MEEVDYDEVAKLVKYTITTYYSEMVEKLYDVDDFFTQIIDDIYMLTINSYNPKKAKFSTFVCMSVHSRIPRYIRNLMPYKSYEPIISIDDKISTTCDVSYQDVLQDNNRHSIEYLSVISNMVDRLKLRFRDESDSRIISLLMDGYTISQIGRIMHVSRQRIRQKLDNYRLFLQKTFKITELSL